MMRDGPALLRERVVFVIQKGKACRVEQPAETIREAIATVLAGAGAPFEVTAPDGAAARIESEAGALAAWLRSPAFAPLAFVAHAAGAKRTPLQALITEDAVGLARPLGASSGSRLLAALACAALLLEQIRVHALRRTIWGANACLWGGGVDHKPCTRPGLI
jgi:hypothetical protein